MVPPARREVLLAMKNLGALLAEIRQGKGPSVLLLHGDGFQVRQASKTLLDLLVPEAERAFNLERFDGRSTPWHQIEVALMTPPFFPGRKTVFVEDVPYFLSREHKGELGEKILQLWREGRKEEASRLFLDLLRSEGWTQERWEKLKGPLPAGQVADLFGLEERAAQEEAEAIVAFCRKSGTGLSQDKSGESHRLMELMEQGLPPWAVLLITASQVDRRTRLYKRFEERGFALDLGLERDRSGRVSRAALAEFLDQRLKEAGKRIESKAREMVLIRAGEELWAVHQELEKLFLYVGEESWIRVKDVEEVFLDQAEAWVFDLTASIASCDLMQALEQLTHLLSQGEHPLKLLATMGSEVRRLLAARHLMDGEMRQRWRQGMTFPEFQRSVLQQSAPLVARSPYGDYLSFQRAENFTTQELRRYLGWIYQADIRLKSTGNPPRMTMERLILEMCLEQS